jgi:hypothetical protein
MNGLDLVEVRESDTLDPNHNAVANDYRVNGMLSGSWEGLGCRMIVANWNSGKAEKKSL